MTKDIDYKSFQAKMNEDRPDHPATEDEAKEALHNIGEFFWLLYKINQREGIVPMEELNGTVTPSDQHNP